MEAEIEAKALEERCLLPRFPWHPQIALQPTVGWALPHKSSIKKLSHGLLAYWPV